MGGNRGGNGGGGGSGGGNRNRNSDGPRSGSGSASSAGGGSNSGGGSGSGSKGTGGGSPGNRNQSSGLPTSRRREGDWKCPDCHEYIFKEKQRCGFCHCGRPKHAKLWDGPIAKPPGNKPQPAAEPSVHVKQPKGSGNKPANRGGGGGGGKAPPNVPLAEAKKCYDTARTRHEAAVAAGEETIWPWSLVEHREQAYDDLLARASSCSADRSGYLQRRYELEREAAIEFAVGGGDDPDEVPAVKAAYKLWKAALTGQPSGEDISPTLRKVKQRQAELASAKFLWKADPANPEGKAQVAAIEDLLNAAQRLDGRSPVDDLRATEQTINAGEKAYAALQLLLDGVRDQMEELHNKQDTMVDDLAIMREGIDANKAKSDRQRAEMAKDSHTPAQAPSDMHLQVQSLLFAVTAMQEAFTRGTWSDGGASAMSTVGDLCKRVQDAMPQGPGEPPKAATGDADSPPPGRRWSQGGGASGASAMEVDRSADEAAAEAHTAATAAAAAEAAAATATQAATAAAAEAARLAAQAEGFVKVGRGGKPVSD
jgi:hypothetical protein